MDRHVFVVLNKPLPFVVIVKKVKVQPWNIGCSYRFFRKPFANILQCFSWWQHVIHFVNLKKSLIRLFSRLVRLSSHINAYKSCTCWICNMALHDSALIQQHYINLNSLASVIVTISVSIITTKHTTLKLLNASSNLGEGQN